MIRTMEEIQESLFQNARDTTVLKDDLIDFLKQYTNELKEVIKTM